MTSSTAEEGLDSCSSIFVASLALGFSVTVSTDDGFDPFSPVILSFLLVDDIIFSDLSFKSDKAASVFDNSGRDSAP